MEPCKELEKKLKKAGKFDKLSVYAEILSLQYQNRDPLLISTFYEAITAFQEYLDFDPHPPQSLRVHLTEVFFIVFQAIRFYAGPTRFKEVYASFGSYRQHLVESDSLAQIYADLSFMFWCQSNHSQALEYGKKSLCIVEESDNSQILPGRYSNVGFIYESMGDFAHAEDYYEKGLNFGMQVNSDRIKSLAYCGFGRVNAATSNFKAAIKYFLEALKHLSDESTDEYMTVCSNLGTAYGKLGDYQESLKYFSKFANDSLKKDNPELYYSSLMNTANCYINLGNLPQAESNLKEVIASFNEHRNLQAVSGALLNLGRIKAAQGNLQEAVVHYQKSMEQIAQTGNQIQEVVADLGLGTVYHQLKDTQQAVECLSNALHKATQLNLKSEIMQCHRQLSLVYEESSLYAEALAHYKQYQACETEIKDAKFDLDIKCIKSQYESKSRKPGSEALYKTHSIISVELAKLVKAPLIGTSKAIREVLNKALLCAGNDIAPVLITGESGTGKEIIARIIHYASARKHAPYTSVNSVAFSDSLVESTFFGSEKGAYTGSMERKNGYFEAAQHGTLFLDEIGEMSLAMQSKLLRVLEEHVIHRVGGTKDIAVDFRLISATNKNLYELTDQNTFRFDLLNRINTLEINLPPLRERMEDIPMLVDYFISLFSGHRGANVCVISKAALDRLYDYHYPGNVRELKNIIQRSILLCNKAVLEPEDIVIAEKSTDNNGDKDIHLSTLNLEDWEKHLIKTAMLKAGNIQAKAAVMLGISPYALNRKLRKGLGVH